MAGAGCADIWGFHDPIDDDAMSADATIDANGPQCGQGEDCGAGPEAGAATGSDASRDADRDAGEDAAGDAGGDAEQTEAGPDGQDASTKDASEDAAATCAAYCVPAPPIGWQGPLVVYEGNGVPPPALPPCNPDSYPNAVFDGKWALDGGPAECTCACGPVTGASCGSPTVHFFSDPNCKQSCSPSTQVVGSTCTTLDTLQGCGGAHFTLEAGAFSGRCAPDASTTVPEAAWEGNARLCGLPSAASSTGCGPGELCAPTASLPFSAYCVARTGAWSCPAGYTAKRTYYAAYVDTRGCSACSCGSPAGLTCSATLSTSALPDCLGGALMMPPPPMGCTSLGGGTTTAIATQTTPSGGACAPSGGLPTGALAPATPTTVCCTP